MGLYKLTLKHGQVVINVCGKRFYGWTITGQVFTSQRSLALSKRLKRQAYTNKYSRIGKTVQ